MKRVVVGVDESEASKTALRWAGSIALVERAELIVLNAFQPGYAELSHDDAQRLIEERQALLDGPWTDVIDPCIKTRRVVRRGDPRSLISDLATAEEADLVVLGRTGSGGGPGFLHLGSVVEHYAHHCNNPLAVVPASAAPQVRRILVGVDGSDESLHAATWSARLAQSTGASVVAVAARDNHKASAPHTGASPALGIEKRVASWASPLAAIGITVEVVGAPGTHPVDALFNAIADHNADLFVVGARGAGGVTGIRAGGLTLKALHEATVPLAMIPSIA